MHGAAQSAAGGTAEPIVAVELHDARSRSSPETGAGRFFELEWPVCLSSAVLPIVQLLCSRGLSAGLPALHYWTVSIALLLVALPALLLTTTEKRLPLSAAVVGGVV